MSRFADPKASERLVLGPCECPGTPHDEDWMDLRSELGAQDIIRISTGDSLAALEVLVLRWNLLESDGTDAPVDRPHLERLFADTFEKLDTWLAEHVRMTTALPNRLGAPSRNGSRASASHIRTIPKRR